MEVGHGRAMLVMVVRLPKGVEELLGEEGRGMVRVVGVGVQRSKGLALVRGRRSLERG